MYGQLELFEQAELQSDSVFKQDGTALDEQVGGDHYKNMKIQPIEFIVTNSLPYREANVIKYVCRHKSKNGLEDLKKAKHYIEMLMEDYS